MYSGLSHFLSLLGALGLFLYGMKVMSDALMVLAGDRLRTILAVTTANRFLAVITGLMITAIIQSSSATTLMVVSFTNAGLLTLTEAVGVIMGANIGTTITAWLISILGFKVSMHAIALPVLGFGFLLSLSKRKLYQHWGTFFVGFALLFIGLQYLKEAMPEIQANPELLAFLSPYSNQGYLSVFLFLGIGTVLTLVVQSSSATMALTLLMCHQGWISFDMAAAMVLGENIGTTITANIAAWVANRSAKQAARAHLLVNLLGVCWILIVFYPFLDLLAWIVTQLEGVSPFSSAIAVPVALALFHSSFNLLNVFLLIGFITQIVALVQRMVPEQVSEVQNIDQPCFLDESSLAYPQTGIQALRNESMRLLENAAYQAVTHALNVHRSDLESGRKLKEILQSADSIPIDIDQLYATKIKHTYSCILEYATRLQSQFALDQERIEMIRNILVADRMLVQVVKQMKPLHDNIERYLRAENMTIRREYNLLRRRILKVIREIHRIAHDAQQQPHLEKLEQQRVKADLLDVLVNHRIDKLVLEGDISSDMASSLLNDSASAQKISQMLVDIAMLLYQPTDALSDAMNEQIV